MKIFQFLFLHGLYFFLYSCSIKARAASPVTLQAVPKLSCRAKMVSIRAVPSASKPKIPVISPKDAMTVPPGTPGAPIPKMPSSKMKLSMESSGGIVP